VEGLSRPHRRGSADAFRCLNITNQSFDSETKPLRTCLEPRLSSTNRPWPAGCCQHRGHQLAGRGPRHGAAISCTPDAEPPSSHILLHASRASPSPRPVCSVETGARVGRKPAARAGFASPGLRCQCRVAASQGGPYQESHSHPPCRLALNWIDDALGTLEGGLEGVTDREQRCSHCLANKAKY
jgi:hypothetical protein